MKERRLAVKKENGKGGKRAEKDYGREVVMEAVTEGWGGGVNK